VSLFVGLIHFLYLKASGPVELVKTKLQVQYERKGSPAYHGPIQCIRQIVYRTGPFGIFKGMAATIYRDVPGYAVNFAAYEMTKEYLESGNSELSVWKTMFAGGIAGIAGWICSYPMDLVKSQIQAESLKAPSKFVKNKWILDGGFFDCLSQNIKQHGPMSVWKGFGPCVARAFPGNSQVSLGL
jgi:solute carrier family 25 carnitine/acylcarnitine transporter 20/29